MLSTTGSARSTPKPPRRSCALRLREGLAAINQTIAVAPAEITGDVQVISTAFASIVADLEKVNFDFNKVTLETFSKFQAPEFGASTQRFTAYRTNVCRIPS